MKQELKKLHGTEYVTRFESEQLPVRLERLIDRMDLDSTMNVCDFGCGNGLLMPYLCPIVSEYVGVDFSEEFIVSANRNRDQCRFKNAHFYCDSIDHFCSQRTNFFDAGFAFDLSEHVPDDRWLEILKSIRLSLKCSSPIYLHTPNAVFFVELMKKRGFILKQFPEHVAVRNSQENRRLLLQAGFKSIEITSLPHYNILKYFHIFSCLPFAGRFFEARLFIRAIA